jgi:hypothetical protein
MACQQYLGTTSDPECQANNLVPGTEYYITVDHRQGYPESQWSGTFTLCLDNNKDYDRKSHALELTDIKLYCSNDKEFNTSYKTPDEAKPGCWTTGPTGNVWFKFTATTPQIEIISKTGEDFGNMRYLMMALLDDYDNVLSCVNYSGNYTWATISYNTLTPGETYYIEIDHRQGANPWSYSGSFSLCVDDGSFESAILWIGATDNDWHKSSNWDGADIPTALHDVDIHDFAVNQPVLSADGVCLSLNMFPGAELTINSGVNLNIGSNVLLQSNSTASASIIDYGNLIAGGTTSIDLNYSGLGWHQISAPTSNVLSGMFTGNYLMSHDETAAPGEHWSYIVPTTVPLTPSKGYFLWSATAGNNTVRYTGPFNTGNQSIGFTYSGPPTSNYGWNLLGNPYPSSIDWDAVSIPTTLDGAIWIYDPAITDYRYYINGGGPLNTTSQYIAPGQAIFTHCTNPAGGTLTFDNTVRVHSDQGFHKSEQELVNMLLVKVSNDEVSDQTGIRFHPEGTMNYDRLYDVYRKDGSGNTIPVLYTKNQDVKYAINTVQPFTNTMKFDAGFYAVNAGKYKISISQISSFEENIKVYLEDLTTETIIEMVKNSEYNLYYNGENEEYPFRILVIKETSNKDLPGFINVFGDDDNITILSDEEDFGNYEIYDLSGRLVASGQFADIRTTINLHYDKTVYIVKCIKPNGSIHTAKVFVR